MSNPCSEGTTGPTARLSIGVAGAELLLEEAPINAARQFHQRMLRSQQVVLTTVPAIVRSHAIPIRCLQRTESQHSASDQLPENTASSGGFRQLPLPAQPQNRFQIRHIRIVHGRLSMIAVQRIPQLPAL